MTEQEVTHICPYCGSRDVPTLIVNKSVTAHRGIGWRCHTCRGEWTDEQSRMLRAS
jgi:hypothetical protein